MDAIDTTRQALLVLAPFVAQGALAKIGESTTDRVTQLIQQAWGLLQGSAKADPKATLALDIFQEEPDDERNRERLAKLLADYLKQHHEAVDELREVVEQLQQQAPATGVYGSVTNTGPNYGLQTGVNYGSMTQSNQTINNQAPNQGAQGTFHGPVSFGKDKSEQ